MENKELIKLTEFQTEALNLLNELENNQLVVELDGQKGDEHRSRCVKSRNPEWYRNLFDRYYSGNRRGRKANSGIRRHRLLKYLKTLSEGVYKDTVSYMELMEEIKSRLFEGYYIEEECMFIPPQLDKENYK